MATETYYLCTPGVAHSASKLTRKPTDAELAVLAGIGRELATLGKRYRKSCVCPVNGDGYWYTRRELLDSNGFVVGSCSHTWHAV